MSVLTSSPSVPPLRILQRPWTPNPHLTKIPHRKLGLGELPHRSLARPEIRLRVALLQDAVAAREVPTRQRKLGLDVALSRRLAVPMNRAPVVDGLPQLAVLKRLAQPRLRHLIPQPRRLVVQLERVLLVANHLAIAARRRHLIQLGELMQRVGVLLVRLLGRALQPDHGLADAGLLAQQALEQDHAELVHGRHVAERRRAPVPLHRLERVLARPAARVRAHLAAHGGAVRRRRVPQLRRALVQPKRLLGVDCEAHLPRAVAVGEVEHGLCVVLAHQLLDVLLGFADVAFSLAGARLGVLVRRDERDGGDGEPFGEEELRGFVALVGFYGRAEPVEFVGRDGDLGGATGFLLLGGWG